MQFILFHSHLYSLFSSFLTWQGTKPQPLILRSLTVFADSILAQCSVMENRWFFHVDYSVFANSILRSLTVSWCIILLWKTYGFLMWIPSPMKLRVRAIRRGLIFLREVGTIRATWYLVVKVLDGSR